MSYRDNTRETVQAPKFPRSDEEVNAILDKRRAEYNERQPPKGWPRYIDPQLPDSALRRALFWRRGKSILVMSVVLLAFVLWFLATMASALSLAIVGELYRFYPKWLHSILSFKTAIDLNMLGWRWCLWQFTRLAYVIPALLGTSSVIILFFRLRPYFKRDNGWKGIQNDRDRLDALDRSIVETEFERLYHLLSGNDRTGVRIAPEETTRETRNDAEVEVEARRPNGTSVAIPI